MRKPAAFDRAWAIREQMLEILMSGENNYDRQADRLKYLEDQLGRPLTTTETRIWQEAGNEASRRLDSVWQRAQKGRGPVKAT